ncbi:MAG: beta-ketoacyl-[acyl-carrier-protein] synthase family protein [Nitrospirae bacterium YQR-1]
MRVVITGIGAVTPIGNSFSLSWESLLAGVNGISVFHHDSSTAGVHLAGKLKNFAAEAYLPHKDILRLDPFIHYAAAAAVQAVSDSGLSEHRCFENAAVIIGTSRGGITTLNHGMRKLYKDGVRKLSAYLMAKTTASMAASYISERYKITGHTLCISNACSSGATALGEALRLIRHGYTDLVLAGGTEAPLCELCFMGYSASGALSKSTELNASRPFDKYRDGFILSEGATIMVLESYERAKARGVRIYAEIAGYANVSDAYHMVKPAAAGEAKAMEYALRDAVSAPGDVDFINAHATSTREGDRTEAAAIEKVFGSLSIPVTANKSMTGHMLGASGAFEAAVTAMSLSEGLLPPAINVSEQDTGCPVNLVKSQLRGGFDVGLTNSFGFGGVNTVLLLKRVK